MAQVVKKTNIITGGIQKGITFIKEARVEARKVVWPDRRYVTVATLIILALVVISAIFVWVIDLGFVKLILFLAKTF